MVNPATHAVATTALIALRVTTSADLLLAGTADADFILPQDQIGGRSFAVQLFRETAELHGRRRDTFVGSYSKSTLDANAVRFTIVPPHVTIKRGETWLFVLYADERPSSTASPAPSPSPSPSPSASP